MGGDWVAVARPGDRVRVAGRVWVLRSKSERGSWTADPEDSPGCYRELTVMDLEGAEPEDPLALDRLRATWQARERDRIYREMCGG